MNEKTLKNLVDDFHRNIDTYKTNAYNEANTRIQFIDRFFELLGWDVNNKQGFSEAYKEVVHEDSLKIGSYMKAPDYSFRLGGSRIFFVEAKKPAIDIKNDIVPAYQLRRYGWTAKLPVSILTDFEEFAVYDCRVKPNQTDKASTARILYFTYKDFLEKWDEIYALFGKENILKGSLENFVKSAKKIKGSSEVDKEFLKEISSWRDVLARNIALRNPNLSSRDLNFCVQRTIDRIIFLRMCEDRGIEDYGRLKALTNGGRIYPRLFQLFQAADDRYNSGLFYFRKEKGREELPDEVSPLIEIDDKIIKNILTGLYYPDCPYEFSVLPADILGNVYEQFLGKVIRLTAGHQAKVEEKPEVKKAGGVYYTPKYIVDYIVENTIGEKLKQRTEDGGRKTENKSKVKNLKLKILDPACGSGSFLLGAYQYLLDWHLKFYSENDPEKWLKKKNPPIFSPPFLKGDSGGFKLTTTEKKRILVNHIYGVDIDSQAVEVTKLSLLLKVLEDVNQDVLESQLKLFHERALPDLSRNIKCGNSLIGPDFYENQQLDLLDEEEQLKINVFDWQSSFPDVFNQQNPGFDVVIGNPPYVNIENLEKNAKEYYLEKFDSCKGRTDIYVAFIEKGLKLLNGKGNLSFIIPYAFTNQVYGTILRKKLIDNHAINEIVDTSNYYIFNTAKVKNIILNIGKTKSKKKTAIKKFTSADNYISKSGTLFKTNQKNFLDLKDYRFETKPVEKLIKVRNKILENSIPFGKICFIAYGARLNHRTKKISKSHYIHKENQIGFKPLLEGKNINRYSFSQMGWLDYIPSEHYNSMFPELFENEKLMFINIVKDKLRFTFDEENFYNSHTIINCVKYNLLKNATHISARKGLKENDIELSKKFHYFYLLGILNSNLISWYFKSFLSESLHFYPNDAKSLPIKNLDLSNPTDQKCHEQMTKYVDRMLELHKRIEKVKTPYEKTNIQNQISATDKAIDKLVYELYELTEKEIKIVEGALT